MPNDNIPECCKRRGLFFGETPNRPYCPDHRTDRHTGMLAESERRAPGVLSEGNWPYGPNINVGSRLVMLDWAERHGLRECHRNHFCGRWLAQGYCRKGYQCPEFRMSAPRWQDHPTTWKGSDGKPAVLVFQPYELSAAERMEINTMATESGAFAQIYREGWYGSRAWFVGLWAPHRQEAQ